MKTFNSGILTYRIFRTALTLMAMTVVLSNATAQDGPVGSLGGEVAVTPLGTASYSIPVEVVPGTNGVQPSLAITYNSAVGRGLLGTGWSLTGLSSVSRIPQDPYHDGAIGTVGYGSDDRFSLDGMRLVKLSTGDYAVSGAVYGTEQENYTRVQLKGTPNTSTHRFEAVTADGTVIEYGSTSTSRQTMSGGGVLSWLADTITDAEGNYMTIQYAQEYHSGEPVPLLIQYTGNAALGRQTYASVRFNYSDDPNSNSLYVGNQWMKSTKLLTGIKVRYGNEIVRSYAFEYDYDRSTRLTAVVLRDGSGAELTRTAVEWGDDDALPSFTTLSGLEDWNFRSGDFNGDHKADLFLFSHPNGIQSTSWQLRKGDGLGNFTTTHSGTIYSNLNNFMTLDTDGDGKDEIAYILWDSANEVFLFKTIKFTTNYQQTATMGTNPTGLIHAADFLGDGTVQLVFESEAQSGFKTVSSNINNGVFVVDEDARLSVTDLNGNGKADIQVTCGNSIDIYEFDEDLLCFSQIPNSFYLDYAVDRDWFADLNGDGCLEYLFYSDGRWYMALSKGNDYWIPQLMPFNSEPYHQQTPEFPIMIADLNGDGLDDVVQVTNPIPLYIGPIETTVHVYYSRGYESGQWVYDTIQIHHPGILGYNDGFFIFADLNGDGKSELVFTGSVLYAPVFVNLPERRGHDLVSAVTDGYGKVTAVEYGFYNSPRMSHTGQDGRKVRHALVARLLSPDGIGGTDSTAFTYGNAVFDRERRRLLGFVSTLAYHEGTNVCQLYQKNDTCHHLFLEQSLTYHFIRPEPPIGIVTDPSFWNPSRDPLYHYETLNTPAYFSLAYGRFIPYAAVTSSYNRLRNAVKTVDTRLGPDGRPVSVSTRSRKARTENGVIPWTEYDSVRYTYGNVTLPNGKPSVKLASDTAWSVRNGYPQMPYRSNAYAYSGGRLSTVTASDSDGGIGVTSFSYNSQGLPLTVTYTPDGMSATTKSFTYDPTGRFVTSETNPLGHIRSFTNDSRSGLLLSETDPNGLVTTHRYDAFGRDTLTVRTDGTSHHTKYLRNTVSVFEDAVWYSVETEEGKPEARVYRDILGRTVHAYHEGRGHEDTVYDSLGLVTATTVAPYDNPGSSGVVLREWRRRTFDIYGRILTESAPYDSLEYTYYSPDDVTRHDDWVSVHDLIRDTYKTTTFDASGRPVREEDEGGSVRFSYGYTSQSGRILDSMAVDLGNATFTTLSDIRGNRLVLRDPDAGTVTCTYDNLGRTVSRVDARGDTSLYSYDALGRIVGLEIRDGVDRCVVDYYYDNASGAGLGRLSEVDLDGGPEEMYGYDLKGRLARLRVFDADTVYEHLYGYDALGRLERVDYPDGYSVVYSYNSLGEPWEIREAATDSLVYAVDTRNKFRQPLKCRFGNGTGTQYTYNAYGMVTGIKSGYVTENSAISSVPEPDAGYNVGNEYRQLVYAYDGRGFIASRSDLAVEQTESYEYDGLDRLVSHDVGGVTVASIDYDESGNIYSHSRVGTYSYSGAGPHAVTQIVDDGRAIPPSTSEVAYGLHNRPVSIVENGYDIRLDYDASGKRRHTTVANGSTPILAKTRVSDVHEIVYTGGSARRLDYIQMDGRTVAVHVSKDGSDSLYYVLEDHLGSWNMVVGQDKGVVQQTHFDPWGNRMTYKSWNVPQTMLFFPFDRGFTGHEHYDCVHIINANARLYDPVIARFFSPDPFVQMPDFSQSYNRYSYCLNNPVMLSDPSGEVFGIDDIIEAAAIGAIINGFTQIVAGNVNNVGDFFIAMGIGAVSCVAGLAVGSGVNAAIAGGSFASGFTGTATVTSTGFWAGASTGATSGLTSGFITGTGNSLLAGKSFGQSIQDGLTEGVIGFGSGAVIGGIWGGIDAYLNNKYFWTGKPPYYEASLENYSLVYQSDDMNCKNAVLESIEKMNGGTRSQADFKIMGDMYLKQHPEATLEEYFEYFGFTVKDPAGRNYRSLGNLMKAGCPTVIEENISGGHTSTIYRIRQWKPSSKISVWLADPARGIWKIRWSTVTDSKFNKGLYTFILSL